MSSSAVTVGQQPRGHTVMLGAFSGERISAMRLKAATPYETVMSPFGAKVLATATVGFFAGRYPSTPV